MEVVVVVVVIIVVLAAIVVAVAVIAVYIVLYLITVLNSRDEFTFFERLICIHVCLCPLPYLYTTCRHYRTNTCTHCRQIQDR